MSLEDIRTFTAVFNLVKQAYVEPVDDRKLQEEWTQRGLDHGALYWAGPLYNNLGSAYYDDGDYERALQLYELALEARLRDPDNAQAIEWAHEAIADAKQALARA